MPTPLTAAPTWSTVVPTPDDTEGATGAGLDGFAQPLLNRTQYLYEQIFTLGVPRVRNVPNIATLKATTGMAHTDVRAVVGYGLYVYDSGSSATEELPWIVQPTTGGGRWLAGSLQPFQTRHVAYRSLSNALLHTGSAPSAVWTTPGGLALTLPASVQATDIIEVAASVELKSAGAGSVSVCIGFAGGSGPQTWDDSIRTVTSTTRTRVELLTTRDASGLAGGVLVPLQVSIYVKPNGSDDALLYGPGTFRVRVTRP